MEKLRPQPAPYKHEYLVQRTSKIILVILFFATIYFIYAFAAIPKKWPFRFINPKIHSNKDKEKDKEDT